MNLLEFSGIIFIFSYISGVLGSLTGLGGGIIIIPVLVLLFDINIHYAMGASLLASIANSSIATISLMRKNYINVRISMLLETGAIVGAVIGSIMLPYIHVDLLLIMLGFIMLGCIVASLSKSENLDRARAAHPLALQLNLDEFYPVYNVPYGMSLMTLSGMLSGLFGIGSGSLKVLILDLFMGLPYKVATSTSSFMIGITAAASAGIYFSAGYINLEICFPVILGVFCGGLTGSKILLKAKVNLLRRLFNIILAILALQMIYKGFIG